MGKDELEPEARDQIAWIAQRYIDDAPFSQNAPRVEDATKWLDSVDKALLNLVAAYTSSGGGGAKAYAESIMNEHLAEAGYARFSDLLERASAAGRAITCARADISGDGHPRFDERDEWRNMIIRLWKLAQDRGWKPSTNMMLVDAAADDNGAESRTATRFIEFVGILQEALPPGLPRHNKTDAALTKAVAEATRALRQARNENSG
ncbi:hypothetical protein [Mesorhizobium sp. WSM2561]|uniref:hypothetical protein n=1 Tax=Mesorhizobium sp. WSM2561 TaxID=1040985 RepID=UPI0012EC7EBC|nr:hypothetical protein [Mesorhizobium sp. WSM2561]